MLIYAVDPGTEESALVVYSVDPKTVLYHALDTNDRTLEFLVRASKEAITCHKECRLVIEEFESYGMAVGKETFRTVWWSGRFYQAWDGPKEMRPRRTVKLHICGHARATDANIRQQIIDLYGGKLKAIGNKSQPGPLYGLKGHEYAALALAITHAGHGI
jgi:hypothetical protein